MPSGVAAFPNPNMFATMFIDIFSYVSVFFSILGNKIFIIGFRNFVIFFIAVVLLAICIIPFHRHIVPSKVIHKFTAEFALSNIELFIFFKFPDKIAYIIDIIKNDGHNIFNI